MTFPPSLIFCQSRLLLFCSVIALRLRIFALIARSLWEGGSPLRPSQDRFLVIRVPSQALFLQGDPPLPSNLCCDFFFLLPC